MKFHKFIYTFEFRYIILVILKLYKYIYIKFALRCIFCAMMNFKNLVGMQLTLDHSHINQHTVCRQNKFIITIVFIIHKNNIGQRT